MPKRRTFTTLGGGLLLALALSGCGGAADQEAADTAAGDSAQAEARVAPAADTASCPGPAPQPFAALDPKNNSQPWSLVTAYLQQNALGSDSAVGQMKLCRGCDRIQATLRPLANTCAIKSEDGQTWMMGRIVANAALTGVNKVAFGGNDNDSSLVYLVMKSYPGTENDSAFVIYPRKNPNGPDPVIGYVRGVQNARWMFKACEEPRHGTAEWGKFKAGTPPSCDSMPMAAGAQAGDSLVEPGGDDTTLTYGWMTCIGGCCRFYGPQPPNPLPEEARPELPGRPEETGRPEKRS
ncbi:MAG TPA: hypothetical protein VFR81_08325 [Longimicrobium sp.]|nr:hypothetical protein [Longimicrobium sp.]